MAMKLVMAMMVILMVAVIGAGLIVLHHLLERKNQQAMTEQFKKDVIPELEEMALRTMSRSMDMIPDKMVEMTKKIMEISKEFENNY